MAAVPGGVADGCVHIRCGDGARVAVPRPAALLIGALRDMLIDGCSDDALCAPGADDVQLMQVDSHSLAVVVDYCERWAASGAPPPASEVHVPDDADELVLLIEAATYLNVEPLLEALCEELARRASGKSASEIRRMLRISDDLSPAEVRRLRDEHAWAWPA